MSASGFTIGRPSGGSRDRAVVSSSDLELTHHSIFDLVFLGFLLVWTVLTIHFHKVGANFINDDVSYLERALSLLRTGFDGFNGRPETTQPPGLPWILAGLCYLRACSYGAILSAMAVFEALGFGVTYLVLRREVGRLAAAALCVLLAASPLYFSMATEWVSTTLPFFFTIMSALYAARKLEESTTTRSRLQWGVLLVFFGAASIMIATAGIALIAAVVVRIGITLFRDRHLALVQLKNYAALLLVGIAVQGLWMHRKPAPLEWPLPGYPAPYLQQLALKSGPDPELGYATWRDVAVRVETNLRDETVLFDHLFSSRWINPAWWSISIGLPLLLMFLGWGSVIWQSKGNHLDAWFFGGYQGVYLLWPWKMEMRYFLPIAPLACLFLWRGVQELIRIVRNQPRVAGIFWIPVSAALVAGSLAELQGSATDAQMAHGGAQGKISLVLWCLSGILAAWMAWKRAQWHTRTALPPNSGEQSRVPRITRKTSLGFLGITLFTALFLSILKDDDAIRRENLDLRSVVNRPGPDVEAAKWIQTHTERGAAIMARHVPITYYYADRKIVWFPPSSDAQLLINGIVKHKVDYVISIDRDVSYYLPPDDECMAALLKRYGCRFQLVQTIGTAQIFRVNREDGQRTSSLLAPCL